MTDPVNLIDRQTELANYLVAGFPKLGIPGIPTVSAAAAVGNGTQENQCRSVTTGALDHGSNGIFQWRDSGTGAAARLSNMQAFGVKYFGTWQCIQSQAAFFLFECKGWYKSLWADLVAGTKSLATLTANIMAEYEVPAAASAMEDQRIAYATAFMKSWTPDVASMPPPPPAQPSSPAPASTAPLPILVYPGAPSLMDTALIAALAPIVESLAAGLFRALITQLSTQSTGGLSTPAVPAPTAPAAIDVGSLVTALVPSLASQLSEALPSLIAAEIAKLTPTTVTK